MPPKLTSPESICAPSGVSGHRGAGSHCWWVLLVGGGAALRCRLPLGGLEQWGDTEAHGYPRGRGGCGWGHWAPPCSATPSAEGSEGFLACVSSGTFRGVCKKIDHFPEDADYEQDTAEYLLRESPSARCPHPQQPPSSPQLAAGRGVAAPAPCTAAPTWAPTRRDTGTAQPAGKHGDRLRGPAGASTEVSGLVQLLTPRGKGPRHPLPLLRGCCWSGRCAELPVL